MNTSHALSKEQRESGHVLILISGLLMPRSIFKCWLVQAYPECICMQSSTLWVCQCTLLQHPYRFCCQTCAPGSANEPA